MESPGSPGECSGGDSIGQGGQRPPSMESPGSPGECPALFSRLIEEERPSMESPGSPGECSECITHSDDSGLILQWSHREVPVNALSTHISTDSMTWPSMESPGSPGECGGNRSGRRS